MRAVALLRGVNVGGVRFSTADLVAPLEDAGFTGVRTVLASGNVLLSSGGDEPAPISAAVSAAIRTRFGFDVAVVTVPLAAVREAVDAYPFPRVEGRHAYIVLADDPAVLAGLIEGQEPLDPAVEQVRLGGAVLFWDAPKGQTLTTVFGRRLGARQRAGTVTTRNLRTFEKVLAAG